MTTPKHSVMRDGVRYYKTRTHGEMPSVSSVISAAADADTLAEWKVKQQAGAALDAYAAKQDRDAAISAALTALDGDTPATLLGTAVHDAIDQLEKGFEPEVADPKVLLFVARYLEMKELYRISVLRTELTLVNLKHRFCGTADGIWMIDMHPGSSRRGPVVADLKTGQRVTSSAGLQLAALANCTHYLDDEGNVRELGEPQRLIPGAGFIAHLRPKSAKLYHVNVTAYWETFKALRNVFDYRRRSASFEPLVAPSEQAELEAVKQYHTSAVLRIERLTTTQKGMLREKWKWRSLFEPAAAWAMGDFNEVHAAIDDVTRYYWGKLK